MIEAHEISAREVRIRIWASLVTVFIGIVVLLLKFWAFNVSRSQSIYSDAMESIVNVVTAIAGVIVVYYASKPADEDHPYGHGKLEYFLSAFEGGLITFAAIIVFIEAIQAFVDKTAVRDLNYGLFLISISGLINVFVGYFLKQIGQKYASPTLESAGIHLYIDFWTTLGAVTGVILVNWTGILWIDRAVALILGTMMAFSGLRLVKQSISRLLDAEDIEILSRLAVLFEKHVHEGIIQIHHAKVIRSGWFHHIDAHIVVPEFWTIEEAHEHLSRFEDNIISEYEYGGEANFHLDPCKRKYCSACDYPNCPVRVEPFQKRMAVEITQLRSKIEPLMSNQS